MVLIMLCSPDFANIDSFTPYLYLFIFFFYRKGDSAVFESKKI